MAVSLIPCWLTSTSSTSSSMSPAEARGVCVSAQRLRWRSDWLAGCGGVPPLAAAGPAAVAGARPLFASRVMVRSLLSASFKPEVATADFVPGAAVCGPTMAESARRRLNLSVSGTVCAETGLANEPRRTEPARATGSLTASKVDVSIHAARIGRHLQAQAVSGFEAHRLRLEFPSARLSGQHINQRRLGSNRLFLAGLK